MGLMRTSRENCLKFLFQQEFLSTYETNFNLFKTHFIKSDLNDTEFIKKISFYVLENKSKLDESISSFSDNWKIERIALVDLLLLRMAIAEIELKLTAPKIVINEILEIAKVYSSKDSVAFINGLLDQWSKKHFNGSELPE
jgi:transcription antitermination protein NusB